MNRRPLPTRASDGSGSRGRMSARTGRGSDARIDRDRQRGAISHNRLDRFLEFPRFGGHLFGMPDRANGIGSFDPRLEVEMAVALVQEFKVVGSDRPTGNYDHIAKRLDLDSNPPEGLIAQTAGWEAGAFMRDRLRPDPRRGAGRPGARRARPRIDVRTTPLRSRALSAGA